VAARRKTGKKMTQTLKETTTKAPKRRPQRTEKGVEAVVHTKQARDSVNGLKPN